jgi:drug/metabolite transporter (DMT)-like permease
MSIKEALQLTYKIITNSSILSGIACQAIAFFMFITVLSWADISFVRPATALTYLFSMLGAKLMLKETFTREKLIGIILIGVGVILHQ